MPTVSTKAVEVTSYFRIAASQQSLLGTRVIVGERVERASSTRKNIRVPPTDTGETRGDK
jgi:hypothetical protein